MKKLFLILLDAKVFCDDVAKFLKGDKRFGVSFSAFENSLFVYSSLSSNEIHDVLLEHWGSSYRHFVAEVDDEKVQGWMSTRYWEIIKKKGARERYDLNFRGYYVDLRNLPPVLGVLCVYECYKDDVKKSVDIRNLIAIEPRLTQEYEEGASNFENRFLDRCVQGANLCFSIAQVDVSVIPKCVRALRRAMNLSTNVGCETTEDLDVYITTSGANDRLQREILFSEQRWGIPHMG